MTFAELVKSQKGNMTRICTKEELYPMQVLSQDLGTENNYFLNHWFLEKLKKNKKNKQNLKKKTKKKQKKKQIFVTRYYERRHDGYLSTKIFQKGYAEP